MRHDLNQTASAIPGAVHVALPHNTMAVLWMKDSTDQETRSYFEEKILAAFSKHRVHGRYVILIAQTWAVAAGEF